MFTPTSQFLLSRISTLDKMIREERLEALKKWERKRGEDKHWLSEFCKGCGALRCICGDIQNGQLAAQLLQSPPIHTPYTTPPIETPNITSPFVSSSIDNYMAEVSCRLGGATSDALQWLANDLGRSYAELMGYADEDHIGGHRSEGGVEWDDGAIGENEGKILYTIVRTLRPRVVLEIGTFQGCSTYHIARALQKNGSGKVYTVDIDPRIHIPEDLQPFISSHRHDALTWECPEPIDFLYEDGAHTAGFTKQIIERFKSQVNPGGIIVCHDYNLCGEVQRDFVELYGDAIHAFSVNLCGLGYYRSP